MLDIGRITSRTMHGMARPRVTAPGSDDELTFAGVVTAAVSIIDTDGLEALTMRRLASDLGIGPMTLYRFSDDKADLLRHVVERVIDEARLPTEASADWAVVLRAFARAVRGGLGAHPHLLPVVAEPTGTTALVRSARSPVVALTMAGFEPAAATAGAQGLVALVVGLVQQDAAAGAGTADLEALARRWTVVADLPEDARRELGFQPGDAGAVRVPPADGVTTRDEDPDAALSPGGDRFDEVVDLYLDGLAAQLSSSTTG